MNRLDRYKGQNQGNIVKLTTETGGDRQRGDGWNRNYRKGW